MPEIHEENQDNAVNAAGDERPSEQETIITEDGEIIRRGTSPYAHRQLIFEEPSVG